MAERGDLDNGTDNHDIGATEHHVATTEALSEKVGKHGTEEATDFIDGSDGTLDRTTVHIVRSRRACLRKLAVELARGNDTGHETLVITEEGLTAVSDRSGARCSQLTKPVVATNTIVYILGHQLVQRRRPRAIRTASSR